MSTLNVRVSLSAFEADLEAVVWPGLSTIYCPRVESAEQLQAVGRIVSRLERLRGIRPGTIAIQPLIESPGGVVAAGEIAPATERIRAFGTGPRLPLHLDAETGEAIDYARCECELVALAYDLAPASMDYLGD